MFRPAGIRIVVVHALFLLLFISDLRNLASAFLHACPSHNRIPRRNENSSRSKSNISTFSNIIRISSIDNNQQHRLPQYTVRIIRMVSFHGHSTTFVGAVSRTRSAAPKSRVNGRRGRLGATDERSTMSEHITRHKAVTGEGGIPPDPKSLLHPDQLDERVGQLVEWFRDVGRGRNSSSSLGGGGGGVGVGPNIFCLTGAGLSTDSGIPDYRGFKGSYHVGHKPIIHQMFMESMGQRQRYWGRSMVGWSKFDDAKPNRGHHALAALEANGWLGVPMEDRPDFYEEHDRDEFYFSTGQRRLAILTQNVDSLHQRAGSTDVLQLHGEGRVVRCMNCGYRMDRNDYHRTLEDANSEWLEEQKDESEREDRSPKNEMRPDGDAELQQDTDYSRIHLPSCPKCHAGFFKPDVVFFGDTVPTHRVAICQEAVESCSGILVVGTSLAVHSAYRHIRSASQKGIPVAILNVGETRAEAESLGGILKIEAPIGETLQRCVQAIVGV